MLSLDWKKPWEEEDSFIFQIPTSLFRITTGIKPSLHTIFLSLWPSNSVISQPGQLVMLLDRRNLGEDLQSSSECSRLTTHLMQAADKI